MVAQSFNSVTLAHPAPTPFVQQVGRALYEANLLSQFTTTIVYRPDDAITKALTSLGDRIQFDLAQQLSRRAVTEFPLSLVKDHPWHEILQLLIGRFDRDRRLSDWVFHRGIEAYDRWVAQETVRSSRIVYGYETACLATFEAAKQQGIACIYDVPAPEHEFVENLLSQELQHYPELETPYRKYVKQRQAERTQRRRKEWELADVVIANSEFTKASYAAAGLDVSKARVVPYGAPPVNVDALNEPRSLSTQFLWAGTFSIRKGAHYLLQAWKQLQPQNAQLQVFGSMGLPSSLIVDLPDSIHLSGTVPRAELYRLYRQADVLVFPTLCDGFGMVVTEAFAQGLPVITTDRAGAADLIQPGVNGFIVPAGDPQALAETLEWCITHRSQLQAMRKAALETAAKWQWSDYRRSLIEHLRDGLDAAGFEL
ncbi:MAG: glycosyltransferase family 4 protein [Plectolyngbya sp. WJT66-NPBG17]|jgi:glycosyltransferase involved in cell wall biosynthesis|nr:glycosyltransferase family 4 protein [Plectolyngbya sp. WJT66-NPBG17]